MLRHMTTAAINTGCSMKAIAIFIAAFGLAASPAVLAQGCGGGGGGMGGCSMGGMDMNGGGHAGHEGHAAAQAAAPSQNSGPKAVLAQPAQRVFDNYVKVQTALAGDSFEGVAGAAAEMAKAARADAKQALPPKVAPQTEALAKARDLSAARAAFKSLSESLIQYLKDQKVPSGTYHEAYCPMAKASWLQTDTTIANPYLGKEMLRCGQFKS